MGTILDEELASYAPNVVVSVGTPPVYKPDPVAGANFAQNIFNVADIASKGLGPITKDETGNLAGWARQGNLLYFHIKFYGTPGKKVKASSPPPPPPPKPPSPPPPPPPSGSKPPNTTTAREETPWITEEDPPFTTIEYIPQDLVGVKPPKNPPRPVSPPPSAPGTSSTTTTTPAPEPKNPKTWSPLELASLPYFENFPSAIYIPAIKSCISAPYFAPEAKRHLNGVLHSARNSSPVNTCYLWEVDIKTRGREFPNIRARPDGVIILDSQRKDSEAPYADIYLQPGKWEKKFGLNNGDFLNAFSLILGIKHGGNENQPQSAPWSVEIVFGDMTLQIIENKPGIKVSTKRVNKIPSVAEDIDVKPSTASYITDHFGERPYLLTFIPVWNGILMSHGVPSSSDWGSTITYFPKDRSLDINTQISSLLVDPRTEEQKAKGVKLYPPSITITRPGPIKKRYKAPGIFIEGKKPYGVKKKGEKILEAQSLPSSDFATGHQLSLKFHRCGGAFKFVPIWFTPYSKYHYLFAGAADDRDLPKVGAESPPRRNKNRPKPPPKGFVGPPAPPKVPPPPAEDPTAVPGEPDVFKVESKHEKLVLPIINFTADPIDFRTHLTTIIRSSSKPYGCLSMEFKNVNPDVRRPIQVWGAVVSERVNLVERATLFPPKSDEGYLTIDDLPAAKIKRFSISRSLDGANGEITWDRNDPIDGLLERPAQRIGALRVALTGGSNTTPGIVFTGLAMGNAQEDSPDDNSVKIPLRGREAKLDADGGICLWNCPYFDGWNHKDAMKFLANYGGVPIDSSNASDFRLIFSANTQNPILDFPGGTGVSQAMDTVTKESMSLFFFNRFGVLVHYDAERSSGRNWYYPDLKLESFSDEPDYQFMRNEIIVFAQVSAPGSQVQVTQLNNPNNVGAIKIPSEVVKVRVPIQTNPTFPWARQAIYQIPQIIQSRAEVIRLALRFAEARGRPRGTSRCQVPPNADIELLDTINDKWIITSISHEADTQSKKWTMNLGVEMFVAAPETVGSPIPEYFPEKEPEKPK